MRIEEYMNKKEFPRLPTRKFVRVSIAAPDCGGEDEDMWGYADFCPRCNKNISEEIKYCPECGQRILNKKEAPIDSWGGVVFKDFKHLCEEYNKESKQE